VSLVSAPRFRLRSSRLAPFFARHANSVVASAASRPVVAAVISPVRRAPISRLFILAEVTPGEFGAEAHICTRNNRNNHSGYGDPDTGASGPINTTDAM